MVDSLTQFTESSTALIKVMQKKLGVIPDSDYDKKLCDLCELLNKLKGELMQMNDVVKVSSVCTCTSQSNLSDDIGPNAEIIARITCYKPPRVTKKKKYKYSNKIETKLLAQKKKIPPCDCNKQSYNMAVDACVCKKLPEQLRTASDDSICPIMVCSDLTKIEIENSCCVGDMAVEPIEEENNDPLAWIRKPGSFDPDKLTQDDSHPYVIKTQDNIQLENTSLGFELVGAMQKFADNTAQIDDSSGDSESYSTYLRKCILVAMKLKHEYSKNDIIGICTDNHKNSYIPYIAGILNGNRVVAYDCSLEKKELMNCLQNVTPSIMFVSDNCSTSLQECMQAAKANFKIVMFRERGDLDFDSFESYLTDQGTVIDDFKAEKVKSLEATCVICFNGGIPEFKAVCLSHGAILRQSLRMISSRHVSPVISSFLENSQISSLLVLFSSILNGSRRIIIEQFQEDRLWNIVQKYKINVLHLYPHHCTKLANLPEPKENTSSLMYIFTSGEKLHSSTLARLKEVLVNTLVCQTYEHTELAGVITAFDFSKPEDGIFCYFRTRSCGRPIEGVWYKVIDVKTGKIVHQMTQGELFVKSKLLRNGYFVRNVEEHCDKENWMSTGDVVFYDTHKCFHHINRICDSIKFRDRIVFPPKLEDILLSHPLVGSAVVGGIPNEEDGQHAAALVTVKEHEDIYSKDLEDWIKDKVPEEEQLRGGIGIVGAIPLMNNGKLNRKAIFPINLKK